MGLAPVGAARKRNVSSVLAAKIQASCPGCGAPLSATSVVALAPICSHCGVVITSIGGTLGLTGAYGVSDPTITRRRVEADLAVFREYQMKYRGMLEACKQQLGWSLERYAHLPEPPEFLELKDVPSFWIGLVIGLGMALAWFVVSFIACMIVGFILLIVSIVYKMDQKLLNFIFLLIIWGGVLVSVLSGPFNHFRVRVANGNKPRENARRQRAYEEAMAAALKAAEPLKAAEDHRLRCQIRELEGLASISTEDLAGVSHCPSPPRLRHSSSDVNNSKF